MTTTSTANGGARQAAAEAKKQAESLVEQAREGGERLVSDARSGLEDLAENRKDAAAEYFQALVAAVDRGAGELKRQGYAGTAKVASGAAHDLGGFVEDLAGRPVGELVEEIEGFARKRPAIFFGAALAIGFGAARFLKSSSARAAQEPATSGTGGNGKAGPGAP